MSHKTFSKSTPPVCPSQIQEIKIQLQVGQREPPISVHSIPGCTMCSRKQQYQNQNEKNHKMFTRTNLRINNKYNPAAPVVDRGEEAAPK